MCWNIPHHSHVGFEFLWGFPIIIFTANHLDLIILFAYQLIIGHINSFNCTVRTWQPSSAIQPLCRTYFPSSQPIAINRSATITHSEAVATPGWTIIIVGTSILSSTNDTPGSNKTTVCGPDIIASHRFTGGAPSHHHQTHQIKSYDRKSLIHMGPHILQLAPDT